MMHYGILVKFIFRKINNDRALFLDAINNKRYRCGGVGPIS